MNKYLDSFINYFYNLYEFIINFFLKNSELNFLYNHYKYLFFIIIILIPILFILILLFIAQKFRKGKCKTSKKGTSFGFTSIFKNKKSIKYEEDLKRLLYTSDLGRQLVDEIISKVTKFNDFELLKKEISEILLKEASKAQSSIEINEDPYLIMLVGVNGVGKTTFAARLANFYKKLGKSVILIGADTFRAAAIDQLKHWADKIHCDFYSKYYKDDPGATVYEGIEKAINNKNDLIIVDTGGRLHTSKNLMAEISKLKKVINKKLQRNPDLVLMVLDATMGQNMYKQSLIFREYLDISGIVLTKMDGTAKAGMALNVSKDLKLPIYFIGVGESLDDIRLFSARDYVDKMLRS